MAFDKDAFITALDSMSVMELNDLVKAIEEKFGVSAAAMAAPARWRRWRRRCCRREDRIHRRSARSWCQQGRRHQGRARTDGLGLKEAKDLVDGAPKNVKEAVPKADAEAAVKKLVEAGAKAEVK